MLDSAADDGGFANDEASGVVEEEAAAEMGSGVDVDRENVGVAGLEGDIKNNRDLLLSTVGRRKQMDPVNLVSCNNIYDQVECHHLFKKTKREKGKNKYSKTHPPKIDPSRSPNIYAF